MNAIPEKYTLSVRARVLVCGIVAVLTILLRNVEVIAAFENRMYDWRVGLLAQRQQPSSDIVVIGIDDRSLAALEPTLGRWPWSRGVLGAVIDYCAPASTVAIDVLLAEEDRSAGNTDAPLVDAVRNQGQVVSAVLLSDGEAKNNVLLDALARVGLSPTFAAGHSLPSHNSIEIPFPSLLAATAAVGNVSHDLDDDDTLRSYAVAARYGDQIIPSLALAATIRHLRLQSDAVHIDAQGYLQLGDKRTHLDAQGRLRIVPAAAVHRTYSFVDVLQSCLTQMQGGTPAIPPNAFAGKAVFIGSLASVWLMDREVFAGVGPMEGVRINAAAMDNMLNATHIRVVPEIAHVFLVIVMCLFSLIPDLQRPWKMIAVVCGSVGLYCAGAFVCLYTMKLVLPLTAPVLAAVAANVALGASFWYAETMHRAKLQVNLRQAYDDLKVSNAKLEEYSRTLEDRVADRTRELQEKNLELVQTLTKLKEAQEQLIMQEKLASLGQVTAGIAHEIKNPLNFVNNFSKLSVQLAKDLHDEFENQKSRLEAKTVDYISELVADVKMNAEKISEHGKRADEIVRSMLLNYHGKSQGKDPTDLNALLDENLKLVYHGKKAEDVTFQVTIEKEFDPTIARVELVRQDISRVFLNILQNGLYSVEQKKKKLNGEYRPAIRVTTKNLGDNVEIRIRDNGLGIPPDIIDSVFNPFFTTKPAGSGTGLGLSISYDIVARTHKGSLAVKSEEGEFAEFTIRLPRSAT